MLTNGAFACHTIGLSKYIYIDCFELSVEKDANASNNFIPNCWFVLSAKFE